MKINSLSEDVIEINKSETADTRTCDVSEVSKEQLLKSSKSHISDVKKGMKYIAEKVLDRAEEHDYTKIDDIDQFFDDFKNDFKDSKWWVKHQDKERHHLKDSDYVQDDVNLIDILEMIVDGVMAGLARSGEYREEKIPDKLLRKAYENTIQMLLDVVKVKE